MKRRLSSSGWNNLFLTVAGTSCSRILLLISGLWLLITPISRAIVDTNTNTLSDLWEKQHNNGELFPETFDPQADPDGDGWTNAEEAAAGTDPFDPNPPGGFLRPEILHTPAVIGEEEGQPVIITPEAITVSWPTLVGKQYTLQLSPDLSENWITFAEPLIGDGDTHEFHFTTASAARNFYRVAVHDVDTDGDTLTDAEESILGSNPWRTDSDGDGLSDNIEVAIGTDLLNFDTDGDNVTDGDESRLATNPLTADDLDSDGMPDDWEKFMSDALLEIFPDPGHWGARHAHLTAGNLDPSTSYTSEGMTASAVQSAVRNTETSDSGDPFEIEWQGKFESVSGTYDPDDEFQAYQGYSRSSSAGSSQPLILTNRNGDSTMFDRSTLISRHDNLAWAPVKLGIDGVTPALSKHPFQYEAEYVGVMLPHAHSYFITSQTEDDTTIVNGRKTSNRVRLASRKPLKESASAFWLKTEYLGSTSNAIDPDRIQNTEVVEMKIEVGGMFSEWVTVEAETPTNADSDNGNSTTLLPMESAPTALAVNSDFDEGRIDPATDYAIPDCDDMPGVDPKTGAGNTKVELDAERNHLDGTYTQGEDIGDDLYQGWFGVSPKHLGDDFWDGATVTIRKIQRIDEDTGYQESGQVRFYAKWDGGHYGITPYDFQTLEPLNLVSAGVNLRPNEGVYGASSAIPGEADFHMEGVRPGKITLEWRLQKGAIDVRQEQTFQVETRKSVDEWREEVRYQIRLQTKVKTGSEVDIALYHPGNGFRHPDPAKDNVLRVVAIYDYYQQLFKQMPEKFMWAGMAKVAAAPIYAGMSDLNTWWEATAVTPSWPPFQGPGDRDYGVEVFIEGLLLSGQKSIFDDMAWTHRAYKASGMAALRHVEKLDRLATDYSAWDSLDVGIQSNDFGLISSGNGDLLRREQEEVVQQSYGLVQNLQIRQPPAHPNINGGVMVAVDANGLANAGEWLSANSNNNPIPGGPPFRTTVPGGRLDFFDDRWAWTSNNASGMLEIWTGVSTSVPGFDAGRRASENGKTIKAAASAYSYDPAGLP